MGNRLLYIVFWPLLLFLISSIVPVDVVLGTYRLSPFEASIYAGLLITFLAWVIWDFIRARDIKLDNKILYIAALWLANSAAVWIVARFAHITGLGISSYRWALLLGLAVALAQSTVWAKKKKQKNA